MEKDFARLPKVAAIHDISGFGRCALTVIIPTLSAMGVQVCPVPTAVLSTHTGGFDGYTFLDLTNEIPPYVSHWKNMGLYFDAIYSGFLANHTQISIVSDIIDNFKSPSNIVVVDPVMGDEGKIYKTYNQQLCDGMKKLVAKADVITPNVTEATYLTGTDYKSHFSKNEIYDILNKLSEYGCKKIVITGIRNDNNVISAYYDNGKIGIKENAYIAKNYPGTGDIFASCLTGKLLNGVSFENAVDLTSDFVAMLIEKSSLFQYPEREGVLLEKYLYLLYESGESI